MKIELKGPYAKLWRMGYLIEQKGRKILLLSNSATEKTTINYSKYLMTIELGRMLEPGEVVRRRDVNNPDESISNLKLSTLSELASDTNKARMWNRLLSEKENHVPHGVSTIP